MLDWERIEELRDEVGAAAFPEVVELFLQEADGALAALTGEGTAAQMEAALHGLKGAALNLGFVQFAGLCAEGERAARDGGAARIDLAQLRGVYGAARAAFLDRITAAGFLAA